MRITDLYLAHWRHRMRFYFVLIFFFPFIAGGQDSYLGDTYDMTQTVLKNSHNQILHLKGTLSVI